MKIRITLIDSAHSNGSDNDIGDGTAMGTARIMMLTMTMAINDDTNGNDSDNYQW